MITPHEMSRLSLNIMILADQAIAMVRELRGCALPLLAVDAGQPDDLTIMTSMLQCSEGTTAAVNKVGELFDALQEAHEALMKRGEE